MINDSWEDQENKPETAVCDVTYIHKAVVDSVRPSLPPAEILTSVAERFAVLADPTRVSILLALAEHELCVCDLAALLNISQTRVSHHLRILRQTSLVRSRRDGKVVYYAVADAHVRTLLQQAVNHASHTGPSGQEEA